MSQFQCLDFKNLFVIHYQVALNLSLISDHLVVHLLFGFLSIVLQCFRLLSFALRPIHRTQVMQCAGNSWTRERLISNTSKQYTQRTSCGGVYDVNMRNTNLRTFNEDLLAICNLQIIIVSYSITYTCVADETRNQCPFSSD